MLHRCILGFLSLTLCAVAALLIVQRIGLENLEEILSRQGVAVYVIAIAAAFPLLLPAPLLEIGAGAIFSLPQSLAVNYVGSTSGCLMAFLLGRFLFQGTVRAFIYQNPKLQRIEKALLQPNMQLQLAFLLRLSPVVPDTWLNYMLAAGPVSIPTFLLSTCAGESLYAFVYAYYGFAGHSLSGFAGSSQGTAVMLVGLVATIATASILTQTCSKLLWEAVADNECALLAA